MNTLLQDMIEIADIPDIAVAGIDDIEDAYAGLKNTLEWLKEYPVTENEPVVRMGAKYVGGFTTLRWAMMYGKFHPACPSTSYLITGAVRFAKPVSPGLW